jgi:histidyl-tRNA synthetase
MSQLITPRTLNGFRDYPPALMIPRERLLEQARKVYRSYGFAPIDTPALEYAEILLGKGGGESDRQLYRFMHHDHDVALRFDLTVPFARFAAQHIAELGTPFKRYHMGPVWRGERPGRGRYREFWQCDFDTIGTTANASDIEVALVIHDLMTAINVERFQIRVNNRQVLNGLLEEVGLAGRAADVLRILDKLPKIGREKVLDEMAETAIARDQGGRVLDLAGMEGSNDEILDRLDREFAGNARAAEGTAKLRELVQVMRAVGIREERLKIDLSIARGLEYYTGTIYETFLVGTYTDEKGKPADLAGFGSVCSGGRYDNLAGLFTKQALPGVGASLGLDRLLTVLETMKLLPKVSTPAPVLVVQFSAARLADYQRIARLLRVGDIGVEVYPEAKRVGQQLKYAEGRGFRLALLAGDDEFRDGVWQVKDLNNPEHRQQGQLVREGEVVGLVRSLLAGEPVRT